MAYCDLLEKDAHQCIRNHRMFSLFDVNLRKSLKKVVSYLAHWSPILSMSFESEHHFLPYFVFPFVRLSSGNVFVSFEMIATILLSQCSLWFEFSPKLPFNYLALIENLIEHFEPTLMEFYQLHSVTSSTFAWQPLRSAFSELLSEYQWTVLWDHIISAPSHFLIFVVVAFNCTQRKPIKRLTNSKEISAFFDEPTAIDIRAWLRNAYELMSECPKHLHPNQYMRDAVRLGADGQYCRIMNYPHKNFRKKSLQEEETDRQVHLINQKYMEIETDEMGLMQQIVNNSQALEHQRRLTMSELAQELSSIEQFKHIENQRKQLILSERQLNDRKIMIDEMLKENIIRNDVDAQGFDLQKLLCYFYKRVMSRRHYPHIIRFPGKFSDFFLSFTETPR